MGRLFGALVGVSALIFACGVADYFRVSKSPDRVLSNQRLERVGCHYEWPEYNSNYPYECVVRLEGLDEDIRFQMYKRSTPLTDLYDPGDKVDVVTSSPWFFGKESVGRSIERRN